MSNGLKNKFIYQFMIAGMQVIVPLVTYPYLTRVLGPASIGAINYIDFVSQLFIVLAAFGIPYYAVREIAAAKNDSEKRAQLVSELTVLNLFFSIVATAGFVIVTYSNWHQYPLLYLFASLNIFISALSFEWYLQGTESFRFSAIRTVLIKSLMVAAFFVFIKKPDDYNIYFGIYSAVIIVFSILSSLKVLSENRVHFTHLQFRRHLVPLWHFFLTSSAISVYIYFDTIILQHLTHNEQVVGYYSFTLKMVKIFLLVLLTIGTVLSPRLSYLVSEGQTSETINYINKLLHFILTTAIPAGAGIMLLAPEIIDIIAGEKFLPAVPLLRILAWLPLVIGLSNVFCFQTLVPFKQEKRFLITVVAGCIASVGLNLLLIPSLAQTGAAIASISTEMIIALLSGYLAWKYVQFTFDFAATFKTIFCSMLFIPVVLLARFLFTSSLGILLFSIITCAALFYFLQAVIFKNETVLQARNYILNLLLA